MKKIYSLIVIILFSSLLISCSVDEETSFSPPSWIIGTWSFNSKSFTFTSDNVIEDGRSIKDSYSGYSITEDVNTDLEYKFTFTDISASYQFVKKSDTTLDYYIGGAGPTPLTKQ